MIKIEKEFSYGILAIVAIVAIVGLMSGFSGCTLQSDKGEEGQNLFGQAIKSKKIQTMSISKEIDERRGKRKCDPENAYEDTVYYVKKNPHGFDFLDLTEREEKLVQKDLIDMIGSECKVYIDGKW